MIAENRGRMQKFEKLLTPPQGVIRAAL